MVEVGDQAPDFELENQDAELVKLSDFSGKKVLLAFYPFDFSPVCTEEFTCFQTDLKQLEEANAQVLGISVDSKWAHKAFADQLNISYPLLSDFSKEASKVYGVLRKEGFSERAYFIVDESGKIKYKKIMDSAKNRLDNEELFKELEN